MFVDDKLCGLICMERKDLLGGGYGLFDKAVAQLRKEYTFGKWKVLVDASTEYGGPTIQQMQDCSFRISMTRCLKEKAVEIKLQEGRGKNPADKADAAEIRQMRGVIGNLNWASRMGMPQGAGDASILAATLPTPTVQDLTDANAALRRLMQNDVPIKIQAIPLEHLRLLTFSDASHGNAKGGAAQIGHLICAVHKDIHTGEAAEVSVLQWKSHKNPRAAPSTLLNEATSMSETLADAEWVASWIGLAKDPK